MSKTYSYDEVFANSVEYFEGDELAAKVFADKYALSNPKKQYLELTPTDMHHRLASEFARIEKKYSNPMSEEEIFQLFDRFKYIVPQGSPMAGIGNPFQILSLSNCFVIDSPVDSYGGILYTDAESAHVFRRRGGVGFDISHIRPKGLETANAAKFTDGIGIFMERFSSTCREVAINGRRGAEMMSISCHHPEIETFIKIKQDKTKVTGANISIRLTDEFMNAVKNDTDVELRWPVEAKNPKISKMVRAKDIWDQIIHAAWDSAEPGLLFWDNVLKYTPAEVYKDFGFHHISTNPCGEIVLSANDSCRLLLLNLYSYVKNPFTADATFDFELFHEHAYKAQKLMDDLIDLEIECVDRIVAKIDSDPEAEHIKRIERDLWLKIKNACIQGRRTGLGITALGDCLAALNIRYGSVESIEETGRIYKALAVASYHSSCEMARDRGAFPVFSHELEKDHPFLQRIWEASPETFELYQKYGRRNISNTTTAPAGSVSTLTQTTSGIEPAFLLSYVRKKKINPNDENVRVDYVDELGDSWQEFPVYHHKFKTWMETTGKSKVEGSPYYKATSNDCDWTASVAIQAAAQYWICHSLSKTCNLPKETTEDTVAEVYMKAWELGCKGFTIYRDGSRLGVLTAESSVKTDPEGRPLEITYTKAPKRPKELSCEIHTVSLKGIKWTVLVGMYHGKPYELFMGKSEHLAVPAKYKTGSLVRVSKAKYDLQIDDDDCTIVIKNIIKTAADSEAAWATRMISTCLRHGVPLEYLVEQLSKDGTIVDINNILARILRKYLKKERNTTEQCPECQNASLIYEEGCKKCPGCGWSKCS